jgi:NADPH-dependent 2,4-dienoyl-CoA reductase/sulfur reductase-like enzyme
MMVDCGSRMFGSDFTDAEVSRVMSVAPADGGANGGGANVGGGTSYVIVGGGPAGVAAAETLAAADPGSSIRMIGEEDEPPYSRMAIPYVLTGQRAKVESVDPQAKTVTLSGGETCGYDKLLIATGASPVNPPIDGLDLPGVHHCWTLEDARGIAERAAEGASVVLMGAGFIGCIILQSLAVRKTKLTVVEALDRMVPRMMNETGGNLIKQWCESRGIAVHTSTKVSRLSDSGGRIKVELDNGSAVDADLVVVATGVASNTKFLEGSGVEIDDGIKVDNHLQSSVADIYAAGDCAQGPDFSTGGWSVHAIQPRRNTAASRPSIWPAARPDIRAAST